MRESLTVFIAFSLTCLFNTQSPYASSACPPYYNGSIAEQPCSKEYSLCLDGIRQNAICQDDYVFYMDSCILATESPECRPINETRNVDFDCSSKEDGSYSIGCRNEFVHCIAGNAYTMYCPSNLLYVEEAGRCLESCDETLPTNDSIDGYNASSGTNENIDNIENDDQSEVFDCTNLDDGEYAQGCNPFYFVCTNGNSFISHCPSGLVYNDHLGYCDYTCTSEVTATREYSTTTPSTTTTTTTTAIPTTSTVVYEDQTDSYETTQELATTQPYTTSTSGSVVVLNEEIPSIICQRGQISTFGTCASRFTKCSDNGLNITTKQCPTDTLFDSALLLCVYDLPECQKTNTHPIYYPLFDTVQSPFDDSSVQRIERRKQIGRGNGYKQLIDNPFYSKPNVQYGYPSDNDNYDRMIYSPFSSIGNRAILDDSFRDHRKLNADKILYDNSKTAAGNKVYPVDDSFEGKPDKYLHSDIQDTFIKRSSEELGPQEDPDNFDDENGFKPSDLFGASRKKRQVYGYPTTEKRINNRQSQLQEACKSISLPTFLNFGDCVVEFIYCSGTGVNRMAACPVGETFDKNLGLCSDNCQVSSSTPSTVSDFTTESSYTVQYAPQSGNSIETTTTQTSFSGERCADISNALFSIGCSQEYIHCSEGVAFRRVCPAALYFDESKSLCDYRDNVAECNDNSIDSQLDSSVPSGSYSPTVKPYSPTAPQVPQKVNDNLEPCHGLSDGSHGDGCSASYIVCKSGKLVKTLTCNLGEGFDPSSQLCRTFEQIPSWMCNSLETTTDAGYVKLLPYVSLESVISESRKQNESVHSEKYENKLGDYHTTEATDSTEIDYTISPIESTTTETDVNSSNDDKLCTTGTRASLGFCSRRYLECDGDRYTELECHSGTLFDSKSNTCINESKCGHDSIRSIVQEEMKKTSYKSVEPRCRDAPENSTIAIGRCRTSYIRCSNGESNVEHCSSNMVYSAQHSNCVVRRTHEGCYEHTSRKPTKAYYNHPASGHASFCDGKPDGLFKNPSDCSAIIQCFGGELFEYPSCPVGLAFNEVIGKCDYPQSVEGCSATATEQETECSVHGSFIANMDDCSMFYRCVWGQKVEMKCPSGTLFNSDLSVCDWPSSVPNCGNGKQSDSSSSAY